MKNTFFVILFLIFSFELSAQCYPVFKKLDKQSQFYYEEPSDRSFPYYYRLTNLYTDSGYSFLQYGYYDGNNWLKIGPNKFKGYSLRLLKWGDRIMGFGTVTNMDGVKAPAGKYFGVMEYKAGKWEVLTGCTFDSGDYVQACSNDSGMYVLVKKMNNYVLGTIYKYDTSSLSLVKMFDFETSNFARTKLMLGKNRILLSNVNKINTTYANGFAYIENDGSFKVNSASGFTDGMDYAIDKVTDQIFGITLATDPIVYEFANSAITPKKTKVKIHGAYSPLQVYNGLLIWQSFDQSNNKFYHILCPGDSIWKTIYTLRSTGVSMTNPYGSVNGLYLNLHTDGKSYNMILSNGALMTGIAYIDKDSNCVLDSTEHRLKNYNVFGKSSIFYASSATDDTGYYEMFVVADTVSLNGAGRLSSCAGANSIITQVNNTYKKNIPTRTPVGYDIKLKLISQLNARWNSNVLYGAEIENNGLPIDSTEFEIILDSKLKIEGADSNFYSIKANNGRGRLLNMDYYEKRWVYVSAWIDTMSTKPDSTLCNKAFAFLYKPEIDSTNNRDSACQRVVYSYDPNYKQCSEKIISPTVSTKLDYYIEFQNEGNDDAYDVVVVDALSNKLDWKTLKVHSASHPYSVEYNEGQLKFTFKDIYLKPKKTDEAASKGYIKFSINTIKGLVKGDSIQNNAYIYFDLNAPVITKMSVVKVDFNSSVEDIEVQSNIYLQIYPNPVREILTIATSSDAPIVIYNMLGEQVYTVNAVDGIATFDVAGFAPGIYIVRCGGLSGKFIKSE